MASPRTLVWGAIMAFACVLLVLGILLVLPFLLSRIVGARSSSSFLHKLAALLGVTPPVPLAAPTTPRKAASKAVVRSLRVSTYTASSRAGAGSAASSSNTSGGSSDGSDLEAARSGDDGDECCPICCDGFEEGQAVISLPCKHVYHKECILKWLARDATCPMCKLDLAAASNSSAGSSSSGDGGTRSQPSDLSPAAAQLPCSTASAATV